MAFPAIDTAHLFFLRWRLAEPKSFGSADCRRITPKSRHRNAGHDGTKDPPSK
jgi:hypothetical protein